MRLAKKVFLGLGLIALVAFALSSWAGPANGTLVEMRAYSFPSYEKVEGIEFFSGRSEYDAAVKDARYEFRKLIYGSDNLKVVAYLYKPAQLPSHPQPLIIFCRGSGPAGDQAPQLISLLHRLATHGFVILAPQYRGSDGGEGRDEIGGADLNDVKNLIPLARSLRYVDTDNIFLYGESRGGMMTYQAVRDRLPVNAAAVFGAFTDLEIMNQSPYVQKMIPQVWPDYGVHKEEIIRRRSARYWPEKLSVPLLIMNGGADQQVSPKQPLQLALQLQELGKTYGLVIYAKDNHFIQANREDRDRRAIAWFEGYTTKR